jgi:hypothetical protein
VEQFNEEGLWVSSRRAVAVCDVLHTVNVPQADAHETAAKFDGSPADGASVDCIANHLSDVLGRKYCIRADILVYLEFFSS